MFKHKRVYLDAAASAPVKKQALKVLEKTSRVFFANPGSIHSDGVAVNNLLQEARTTISNFFDSESIVLALEGSVRAWLQKNKDIQAHAVVSDIEHPAVYATLEMLERTYDFSYTIVEADKEGIIDPKKIEESLSTNTVFVSVVYVDSVFGAIADVKEITKRVRHFKKHILGNHAAVYPLVHVDASQALLLQDCSFERIHVDLLSANAQKIGGPKGVGVLVKNNNISLSPVIPGGGQEFGLRGGTPNVPAIVSFATVLKTPDSPLSKRYNRLKTYLIKKLKDNSYGISCVNQGEHYSPHIVSLVVPQLESELVVLELDARAVSVSSQSACADEQTSPRARLLEQETGKSAILRISFHEASKKRDIDIFVSALYKVMEKYKTAGFFK
jgi:cysteine desulfurase